MTMPKRYYPRCVWDKRKNCKNINGIYTARCVWDKRKNCKNINGIYTVIPDREICRICLGITKTQQDKPIKEK